MHLFRPTALLPRPRLQPAPRKGLLRDERGAVAIEFGVLALPFFTLIYAILETSIVFLSGQIFDSAIQDASRMIRTGQAQNAEWDEEDFREEVCDGLHQLFDCDEVKIKVTKFASFQAATPTPPINPACTASGNEVDCNWTITEAYNPGSGSEIVLVEAYYKWPTLLNLPWFNLATQAGNTRLQSAVRVFRNEPF